MVGPAYPSVRMLLTTEANHSTCLEEITTGSARVLKGLCFIKNQVSAQVVTSTYTHIREHLCGRRRIGCVCLYGVGVCVCLCCCCCLSNNNCLTYRVSERKRC